MEVIDPCPGVLQGVSSNIFLTLLNTLMAAQCSLGPEGRYPPDYGPNLKDGDEFDFIVVGSGSAGSVVANRLSEVPQWKVLLLEAGDYPSALTEIPGLGLSLQDTQEDWQYQMESSPTSCLSLKNNKCRCPRGKGLGGSSLLNVMLYTRSTKYDHKLWASLGNVGWDYDAVVKHYKKFENAHIEDNFYYGTNGELHLTRYTNSHPIRSILQKAYEELTYTTYTEDDPIGFRDNLVSIYQGTRQNTAKAFLSAFKSRQNLYVAVNAEVGKLLIDETSLAAQGVEVRINNKIIKLRTKNEVILSSGSINSPRILMSSGIGPKEHLSKLGIKVLKNLPVGENLQEHASFPVVVKIDNSAANPESPLHLVDQLYKFFLHGEGDLTQVGITNFGAYINTYNKTDTANVQYYHKLLRRQDAYLLENFVRAKALPDDTAKSLRKHNQDSPLLILVPSLLHPQSRGVVRLQSTDPYAAPLIKPNLLSDKNGEDMKVFLDAIKILQELIKTKVFSPYNPELIDLEITNCGSIEPQSDPFWRCAIRNIASTSFHPVGTCKMGGASDPEAVVNPRLQVRGVKGVRVIDGSVMPMIVSGNPNSPIIMIGEKGASLVKEDWLNQHDEL